MKNIFKIIILSAATLGFSSAASAQRGARCNVNSFQAHNLAERIQQNSFLIRDTVSDLPRPGKWMPYARPVGASTRTIKGMIQGGQQRGVCRALGAEIRQANYAINQFVHKLNREGRGHYAQDLKRKLNRSRRMLHRLHQVLVR